ncbi:transketolase-like TK C-terminal-containing protein [Mycoplasmopsis gallinarum]|uniref:transketolase-like TK C-terminal-containing protein n=1 Tax=Mycoplasmopsis gallinarum TaxID=29557 RepID=UPI001C658BFE|nr:transketolase [Mycoplasmopsis gallinarum]
MQRIKKMNKEELLVASMRGIALDSINKAKGGHIGMAIGAANITYSLIAKTLNFSVDNPKWINRDKFVLSAGHGSMSYYSIMHFLGLLSLEDMQNHKLLNSKTPSHPETHNFSYVDATTGPLGQGIAMGVGMALSEKYLAQKYNRANYDLFDHYVYVLHGDGCLQEGVALEALQFAGTNKLDRLILIHDYNNIQMDSKAEEVNGIKLLNYFKAMNFATFDVEKDEPSAILEAIKAAKESQKPSYIRVHTRIAKATEFENQSKGHHGTLDEEKTKLFKTKLGLNNFEPFVYDKEAYAYAEKLLKNKQSKYTDWLKLFKKYQNQYPNEAKEINNLIHGEIEINFENLVFDKTNRPTRDYITTIMQHLTNNPYIVGGSADLSKPTQVAFSKDIWEGGQNIKYGIREFAMVAINNGINLASNLRTIDSTFLSFADYAKAAIRLGAIMNLNGVHIFSHDSYQVGGDGPTHQPYDQLPMLRAMDNVNVIRPCDESELLMAFKEAFNPLNKDSQTCIIVTRQPLKSFNLVANNKTAYVIHRTNAKKLDLSLVASGSEVELIYNAALELEKEYNLNVQVISVPNLKRLVNDQERIKKLELNKAPILAVEASSDSMWYQLAKYAPMDAQLASGFGYSAPGQEVYELKGFSIKNIIKKVKKLLNID